MLRLGLVGAGAMGRVHAGLIKASVQAHCVALTEPERTRAAAFLRDLSGDSHRDDRAAMAHFASIDEMLTQVPLDGIIIASPNQHHEAHALSTIAAGIPTLIEKPISTDGASGRRIADAARASGVPILIGHHRRHSPKIAQAYARIRRGDLGTVRSVEGSFWLHKPRAYFDVAWRVTAGGGPVMINLIHDIDVLHHLCGDIVEVRAMSTRAARGTAVEDTVVVLLRFADGALGTLNASDAISAPWSWEMTSGENPMYPPTSEGCYRIGGSLGSITLPQGAFWRHGASATAASDASAEALHEPSWTAPLVVERSHAPPHDPLQLQLAHFCRVITREEAPLVTPADGLQALRVAEAILASAAQDGTAVTIEPRADHKT
ncbi:MAG: Gfo/Idh/MocA family oxidoreductase [Pseudomonadota bacterium]